MKKQLLFTAALILASFTTIAQSTWYDFDADVTNVSITPAASCSGCSVSTVVNPDAGDIANAANVTLLEIAAGSAKSNKGFVVNFPSGQGVSGADVNGLVVTVRFYFPSIANFSSYDSNERVRFYLASSAASTSIQQQVNFVEADEGVWKEYTFTYDVTESGFIDSAEIRLIGNKFDNLDNGLKIYVDTVVSTKAFVENPSLSTNDFDAQTAAINAYPNPVTNSFQIESIEGVENVKLYNISGRLVKTFKANTNYDVSDLATGVYITTIKTKLGTKSLRLVKK
ncbi:T9SS type A sorting domain-containing protein [Polaribacter vadi]|mgnify:CR=1 FL=1|uniref:T9SS type A sorting domain-containing protein n=1 Tax=Polaribacter vadi TaxID=1774273 RepID=UPI0030EB6AF6|tara:strand:+ start:58987 stop:59835 length:849 start_codon:yes stop_codon:yes gene_type:complete